jgi:hypothetical protein
LAEALSSLSSEIESVGSVAAAASKASVIDRLALWLLVAAAGPVGVDDKVRTALGVDRPVGAEDRAASVNCATAEGRGAAAA